MDFKNSVHLLILKNGQEDFYNSVESVIQLINSHDRITIDKGTNTIHYSDNDNKDTVVVNYDIILHKIDISNDRSFDLILSFDHVNTKEEALICKLVLVIIQALNRMGENIQITILWHDIYKRYSFASYKLIFEVENRLRSFIYQLMANRVGFSWIQAVVPDGVEARNSENSVSQSSFLHDIYLTDLTKILFQGQRDEKFRTLQSIELFVQRKIKSSAQHIDIEDLNGIVSKSLWTKYFSDLDSKGVSLETKLDLLSKLRNETAHNKFISRVELGKIESLSRDILKIIVIAQSRIDKIKFTQREKDQTEEIFREFFQSDESSRQMGLWIYMDEVRSKNYVVIKDSGKSLFDAIYVNSDNQRVGVEIKVFKGEIRIPVDVVTSRLVSAADYEKCDEIDLIIITNKEVEILDRDIKHTLNIDFSGIDIVVNVIKMGLNDLDKNFRLLGIKMKEKYAKNK